MTERTTSPWRRWQTIFVLFHYLFSLLIFSLPAHALNPGANDPSSSESFSESSPLRDQLAQFWGSAQQSNASDAARGVANSAVNSALTAEVESWLNLGGGKAKVTLDTGISGIHNRDIGLDYFWPLLDGENSTLFTQLSFHRWNERNQINLGLGYRYDLSDHWMAGGNLFYDRDLSRHHNRLGVGAELWGDGVRTSVNYYHPLSDWRLSHDNNFNDDPLFYDLYERAARGWDLSVEAALSQHVGVKGTWFQWYGDKVDVTGSRSQASRDPYGVTLGANWQPVPLVALNAEHSVISGQDDDTRIGLNLSWQFGRTLDQMLDPAAASALSSVKSARHDFVNRNNNIVLAYQQREKGLGLYFEPNSLTTKAGSTPFTHAVKGGRGGFIVYHSSQPDIAQIVSEQTGTVASLKRGEVIISAEEYQDASRKKLYDRAEYRLTIQPGDFAPEVVDVRIEGEAAIGGTLTGSYTFISNEGEDEGETTQRWYRQNAPETVLSTGPQYQQTAADVGRILVYEVTPVNKAGLRGKPGSAQQAGPQLTLNNLEMTLLHGGGELQANGTIKFKAGETGMLLFEATVLDQDGKPVADQPVYWSHNNPNLGKLDETSQMTNSKGQSLVKFSDITQGGEDIIVASLLPERGVMKAIATTENTSTKTLPLSISFSAASNVTFINPPQKVTVGTKTDFTVLVTDEENQALENAALQVTSNGDTQSYNTGKDGKATFSLVAPLSIDPSQWTVSAVLTDNSEKGDTAQIDLLADNASAEVTSLAANPDTAVVGTPVLLKARVQDKHGNPVRGVEVTFLSAANNGEMLVKHATDEQGVASYPDYTRTVAQVFHPAARLGTGIAKEASVTFTADKVTTLTLQRNFSGDLAADGSTVSWTTTAKDAHNNPVAGAALVWKVTGPLGEITPEKEDKTNAQGDALLTVTLPKTQGDLKIEVASGKAQQQDSVTLKPVLNLVSLEPTSNKPLVGSQVTLTARVTNLAGDPLENVLVDFTNNQNTRMTEQSGVRTDINGLAQATLEIVKGQEQGAAGDYDVKATLSAKPSEYKTTTVSWQLDNAAARVARLSANPTSAQVGSRVQLMATVTDPFGNPLPGETVEFLSAAANGEVLGTQTTNDQGVATYAEYSQKVAASYQPAARVVGGMALETNVVFTLDTTSVQVISLQPEPARALAGAKVALKATVKDQYGNAVANTDVQFLSAASQGEVLTTLTTNGKGEVSWAEYTQTTAGEYAPAARVINGIAQATTVNFTADPAGAQVVAMKATPVTAAAGTDVRLTATVQDHYGNPVKNGQVMVSFLTSKTGTPLGEPVATNDTGEASFSNYQQQLAGDYYPAARVGGGTAIDTLVTYTAGTVTTLELQPDFVDDLLADGNSTVSWTVTAKDAHGNPVPDAALTWEIIGPTGNIVPTKDDKTNAQGKGVVTVTLPGEQGELKAIVKSGSVQDDDIATLLPVLQLKSLVPDTTHPQVGGSVTLTAKVVNKAGTALANVVVNFTNDRADVMEQAPDIKTDSNGEAKATLKILKGKELGAPGNYVVKATLKDKTSEFKEATMTWQPGIGEVTRLTANPTSAAAGNDVQLTATVQDQFGNKVQNAAVTFLSSIGGLALDEAVNSNAEGISTFKYQQSTAGTYRPAASTGNGDSKDTPVSIWGTPSIESVSVTPADDVQAGTTLTATIEGFDAQGNGQDSSTYQWYYRKGSNTDWTEVNGATGKTFPTLVSNAGLEIRVIVTPKGSLSEVEGVPRESNVVRLYGKPTIASVAVTPQGSVRVNNPLNATHSGFNAQGTGEDASLYQWYYRPSLTADWIAIDTAKGKNYTPDNIRIGQQVRVGVTPKGSAQAVKGTEIYSDPITVYSIPSIASVTVTPSGNVVQSETLTAIINGFDAQGTGENASLYQWYSRQAADQAWIKVDKAEQQTFSLANTQPGYQVRVGVTPKGSEQMVTGVTQYSNPINVFGKPTIASVSVTPEGSVASNTALTATINGFNAQGTGSNASKWQWYWRTPGESKWIKAGRSDATHPVFTPDASYDGYEVQVGVTPKGSEQDLEGEEVFSNFVKIRDPITYKITRIKHYYFNNFVAPWVYEPVVKVENNKGQPVSGVEICFKIYRGSIPMPDGVPTLPSQADFRTRTGNDGVSEIERQTGSGTQKIHFRAWICSTNKLPTSTAYMGGGNKDWYDAPTDWQTVVSAN